MEITTVFPGSVLSSAKSRWRRNARLAAYPPNPLAGRESTRAMFRESKRPPRRMEDGFLSRLSNPTQPDLNATVQYRFRAALVKDRAAPARVGPKRIEKHTVETGFVKMINQKNQLKPVFNVRFCKPKLKTVLKVWFCKWKMETSSSTTSDFSASGHERGGRVGWLVQSNFKRQCAFPTLDGAVGRTVRTTSSTRRVAFGLLYQLISYAAPALRTVACR
jgi:hypothetical protein